jgi:hypothetical protein
MLVEFEMCNALVVSGMLVAGDDQLDVENPPVHPAGAWTAPLGGSGVYTQRSTDAFRDG